MTDDAVKFFLASLEERLESAVTSTVGAPLKAVDAGLEPFADLCLSAVKSGGKRLRPRFAFWAWRAVAPAGASRAPVIDLAAAVELLHAAILVHDDVIDDSDVRRGQPSVRAALAARHRARGGSGDARQFGDHLALLVGDLLWSAVHDTVDLAVEPLAPAARRRVRSAFAAMRVEVLAGQFLELQAQADRDYAAATAGKIQRYKTSSYTVLRPVHLGLELAGTPHGAAPDALQRYAVAVGRAFQLRDDLSDLFSTTADSGKRVGDDIRGGKPTELLGATLELADAADRATLTKAVGDESADETVIAEVQRVMLRTGATARIHDHIDELVSSARAAIEDLRPHTEAAVCIGLSDMLAECTDLSFLPAVR